MWTRVGSAIARTGIAPGPTFTPFARGALGSTVRWATHERISVTDLRKGMIYLADGKYCKVKEWQPAKTGRGAASYGITYEELDTGKEKENKYSSGSKVTKVDPDKASCEIMYVVKEDKKVVVADEDYNELEVPMTRFPVPSDVVEGKKVTLFTDGEMIVKVQLLR